MPNTIIPYISSNVFRAGDMCGRFALGLPHGRVVNAVRAAFPDLDLDDEWVDEDAFHPRYNVAPRSRAAVIRRRNRLDDGNFDTSSKPNHAFVQTMKWGLVPHWSKHEDSTMNTINAKSENLVEGGGMWGSIKGRKRCAVLCQGYYEWLKKGRVRLPHFTKHKDDRIMLLAGLYDSVTLEGCSEPLWTFTVVTTDANKQLSWLHDRQPVILSTKAELNSWLDTSSESWTSELSKVVMPYRDASAPLECFQVPQDVGKVGADSPTFIEPISQRKDGIQAMFAKQASQESKSPSEQEPAESSKRRQKRTSDAIDLTEDDKEGLISPKRQKTSNNPVKQQNNRDDFSNKSEINTREASSISQSKRKPTSEKNALKSPARLQSKDGKSIASYFHKT